jgi:two-component system sensor histidine kinase MtrB
VVAFGSVSLITSVVVTGLAYVTSLYLFTSGALHVPSAVRSWVLHHLVRAGLSAVLLFAAVVLLVLMATIAVISSVATQRVLSPLRQLTMAAQRVAEGDLTVRLPVEGDDELAELVRRFNDMASSLQASVDDLRRMGDRARRFAGDVSHELRTPLAAMTAVTDVLDEHAVAVSGRSGQAARLVSQEIRRLNRLAEELIEISSFDAGRAELVLDDVDVGDAVERALTVRDWTDSVAVDVAPGLRCVLDPRRLDVILANLVGNALRHGGPPVQVRARLEPGPTGAWLRITVRDHGPGIPPEAGSRIFDRFYKVDQARNRSGGSGLGLAIAWENARLHGGTITAANHPDGGAVFEATLAVQPGFAGWD